MISLLHGTVSRGAILTSGGVGYDVATATDLEDGATVTLYVHTVMRDASIALYGFETSEERDLFVALCKVPGAGGRTALAVLRDLGIGGIVSAVSSDDVKALTKAAGVGPKLAAKIVTMLVVPDHVKDAAGDAADVVVDEVVSALVELGFRPEESAELARQVAAELPEADSTTRLREALSRVRRVA